MQAGLNALEKRFGLPTQTVAEHLTNLMRGERAGMDLTAFKNSLCTKIQAWNFNGFINCNNIIVDVRSASSFAGANTGSPTSTDMQNYNNYLSDPANNPNPFTFNPGNPGDIIIVRLMYQWPVYVSLLGFNLTNMSGGKRLLAATSAFRNEPYN